MLIIEGINAFYYILFVSYLEFSLVKFLLAYFFISPLFNL